MKLSNEAIRTPKEIKRAVCHCVLRAGSLARSVARKRSPRALDPSMEAHAAAHAVRVQLHTRPSVRPSVCPPSRVCALLSRLCMSLLSHLLELLE